MHNLICMQRFLYPIQKGSSCREIDDALCACIQSTKRLWLQELVVYLDQKIVQAVVGDTDMDSGSDQGTTCSAASGAGGRGLHAMHHDQAR